MQFQDVWMLPALMHALTLSILPNSIAFTASYLCCLQTFDDSVNTCFEILLGEISVNEQLRELGGLQAIAGAFFFWTYMLLVRVLLQNVELFGALSLCLSAAIPPCLLAG